MRWLVTGGAGMLARDLIAVLTKGGHEVRAPSRAELDVLDVGALARAAQNCDVVVNCAAWTAVDDAETEEPAAFAVNALGAARVAQAARGAGARLVQVSTDYVFSGDADEPYEAGATVDPRSAYGRTKAAGEWAAASCCADTLVVRTAWLYGARGQCFPKTIARASTQRPYLEVVDDQVGQPTWTRDLATTLLALVDTGAPAGTYHATASGQVSWYGFAREVVRSAGNDVGAVRPCSSLQYQRPAPRPAYSVLSHRSLHDVGVEPIGPWADRWQEAAGEVLGDHA